MAAAPSPQEARIAVLKETVRQLEVRLAVQTQEKQALESRIAATVPWAIALFAASFTIVPLVPKFFLVGGAFLAAVVAFTGPTDAVQATRRWRYVGRDARGNAATEDELLGATAESYAEGIKGNDSALRQLRSTSAVPTAIVVISVVVMLFSLPYFDAARVPVQPQGLPAAPADTPPPPADTPPPPSR